MIRGSLQLLFLCILLSACSQQGELPQSSPEVTEPSPTTVTALPPTPTLTPPPVSEETLERLLIWGATEYGINAQCKIWIVNLTSQQEPVHAINGKRGCNYTVLEINGKEHLVYLPHWNPALIEYPTEIIVYDMTGEGELDLQQVIPMGDIRLTSATNTPQWAADGSVFLAGVLNDKEQIFRYDHQDAVIETYLDTPDGYATEPLLSPDSRYLAYVVVENNENSFQCDRGTCSFRFFHVWDIDRREDIELLPLIEPFIAGDPFYMHCELEWSPTSKFVAFDIGCGLQEPGSVAIIDIENRRVVEVVNTEVIDRHTIKKYEWLSDDRLAMTGSVIFANTGERYDGYFLYLAKNQSWHPLPNIPERNKYDYDNLYFNDWTEDGLFVVGSTLTPDTARVPNVVVFSVTNNESLYVRPKDEFVNNPLWANSGNYIAYHSYNWESRNSQSRFTIINREGETLLDTGMIEVVFPHFAWLLLR